MKGSFLLAVALIVVFVTVGPTSACKICTGPCTCPSVPHLAPLALSALALAHPPPPPPPSPPAPPCGPPPTALELSIVGTNPYPAPLYPPPAPAYPASYPRSGPPPLSYLPPGFLPPGYLPPYAANYLPDYELSLYGNPFAPPPPPPPCKYCGKKLGAGLKCKCFAKNYLYPDYC